MKEPQFRQLVASLIEEKLGPGAHVKFSPNGICKKLGLTVSRETLRRILREEDYQPSPGTQTDVINQIKESQPIGKEPPPRHRRRSQSVRVMFPHTIMAAPLIALAAEGEVSDVLFASSLGSNGEPLWILPRDQQIGSDRSNESDGHHLVGPVALKNRLDAGDADLIVGWHAPLWPQSDYRREAQISSGLSGCTVGVFVNKASPGLESHFDSEGTWNPTRISDEEDSVEAFYRILAGEALPALHPDGVEGYQIGRAHV